jgi:site-specific DNA-methyltransferase (adenine-specific)
MGHGVVFANADVLALYPTWPHPILIVSDGPYGLSPAFGDIPTPDGLSDWYEPHIASWSRKATPQTTLWLWNSEIGWATLHPLLVSYGWRYIRCHIWDKGIAHVAGNSNTTRLRQFPTVTEVCVQYARNVKLPSEGAEYPIRQWLRGEWERSGLPLSKSNEACGVRNAATRKYLTKDWVWYFPPPEAFERLARYANEYGDPTGAPYFSVDGQRPLSAEEWERMRPKFHCPPGVTNVWREPPLHDSERLKLGTKTVHLNQKPLKLIELTLRASSDSQDIVWDPFGGLATGALACARLGRRCFSAEIDPILYDVAVSRLVSNGIVPDST